MGRELARLVVGKQTGDLPADAGDETDDGAAHRADGQCALVGEGLFQRGHERLLLDFERGNAGPDAALGEHVDDLRDGKNANQRCNDVDAAGESIVKDKALCALNVVIADHRQPQAEAAGEQALHERVGVERTDDGDAKNGHPEQVRWPEGKRPFGQHGREEDEQQHADDSAYA